MKLKVGKHYIITSEKGEAYIIKYAGEESFNDVTTKWCHLRYYNDKNNHNKWHNHTRPNKMIQYNDNIPSNMIREITDEEICLLMI